MTTVKPKSREEQEKDFAEMVKLAHTENCLKCFGRGHVGYNIKLEMYIPCQCLIKAEQKVTRERLAQKRMANAGN